MQAKAEDDAIITCVPPFSIYRCKDMGYACYYCCMLSFPAFACMLIVACLFSYHPLPLLACCTLFLCFLALHSLTSFNICTENVFNLVPLAFAVCTEQHVYKPTTDFHAEYYLPCIQVYIHVPVSRIS